MSGSDDGSRLAHQRSGISAGGALHLRRHELRVVSTMSAGALLTSLGAGWATVIHKPPPPPDMARAPLQPLLVVARRAAAAAAAAPVHLTFAASATGPDAEQLAGVLQVRCAVPLRTAAVADECCRSEVFVSRDNRACVHPRGNPLPQVDPPAGS